MKYILLLLPLPLHCHGTVAAALQNRIEMHLNSHLRKSEREKKMNIVYGLVHSSIVFASEFTL